MAGLLEIDRKIFLFVNGLGDPRLDWALGFATHFGQPVILGVLLLAGVFFWDRRHWRIRGAFFAVNLLMLEAATQLFKGMVMRPRPFEAFPEMTVRVLFDLPQSASFPSGHAAASFAVALLLVRVYGKKLRIFYLAAFWIALSRIYVGVHYPSDVAAGALLGLFGADILWRLTGRFFKLRASRLTLEP